MLDITNNSFMTREDYLNWRNEWRNEYKALSAIIRANKNKISTYFKAGEPAGAAQNLLICQQVTAFSYMEMRKQSKELAILRYKERKAA